MGLSTVPGTHLEKVDADASGKGIIESTRYSALTTHVQHLYFLLNYKFHKSRNNTDLVHGFISSAWPRVKAQQLFTKWIHKWVNISRPMFSGLISKKTDQWLHIWVSDLILIMEHIIYLQWYYIHFELKIKKFQVKVSLKKSENLLSDVTRSGEAKWLRRWLFGSSVTSPRYQLSVCALCHLQHAAWSSGYLLSQLQDRFRRSSVTSSPSFN